MVYISITICWKGADMIYYKNSKQMDLSDRIAIETGICRGDSFKQIAKRLNRHPSTIAHEVKENRALIHSTYPCGKDCKFVRNCHEKNLCGCDEDACRFPCRSCRGVDCTTVCRKYVSIACHKFERAPYVCNTCPNHKKTNCIKARYIYSAKYADAAVCRRRSESRQGIRISDEQLVEMDELITKLVKKGQPLTHIYAEHEKELPVGLRSLYNYIDSGNMTIKNIDLRRKTSYKQRRANKKGVPKGFKDQSYREGRTYEDYEADMKFYSEYSVTEMDTVKGRRERGKRLLTMILRKNSIMLMFLMPDGTAASVKRVFDYLEAGLGTECFRRIFEIILTDNGGEFKKVDQLELNEDYEYRTRIYYCDPMASWQKPHIEKNHEYIRYVIPQGVSFNAYTEEDMTLLMNHINSTRRVSLGGKAPYELITEDDEDMWALWRLLKMDLIPPDEVHLKPDLFAINK
jgi:IS30 family transposase